MKEFLPGELNIPYGEMTTLRNTKLLVLGLDEATASDVVRKGLVPKAVRSAYHFWGTLCMLLILGSIGASFFYKWWVFIPGIVLAIWILNAAKRANVSNVIDAAVRDQSLYTLIGSAGRWQYTIKHDHVVDVMTERFATGKYAAVQ